MLKKLIILAVLACLPLSVMGAAPTNNSATVTTATMAIDSQHTGVWKELDSMIVIKTDSCDTYYHYYGTAVVQPGQKLYVGFVDGDASAITANIASGKMYQLPEYARGPMTIAFGGTYLDSLRHVDDANDSIRVVAAVKGNVNVEFITITGFRLTGTVIDMD